MKFLIHSQSGDGAGIAWRLKEEGNDVSMYIEDANFKNVLKNMVPSVKTLEEGLSKDPDVIIFDMSGSGEKADLLRKQGKRVIGAGKFNDMLELDRTYAMNIAKRMGIKVPPFTVFNAGKLDEAIKFVQETGKRYVLKPHGNLALDMTYVARDADDMIQELEWAKDKKILKGEFILQEFIKGIEISSEVWFSNGEPVPASSGTLESKKFMSGDLGPNTGCESSVVWPYETDHSKILQQTIRKVYPIAKEFKYNGPLDVNSIIAEDGNAYFLEFTPRIGYSAIYAFAELIDGDLGEFFYYIALKRINNISLESKVGMAITLSIPPYPLNSDKPENRKAFKETEGKRIYGTPEDGFWPFDVMEDKGNLVTAGTLGLVCYLSAKGKSVEETEELLYGKVDKICIPNAQYRIDAAERSYEDIPKLQDLKYDVPFCKKIDSLPEAEPEEESGDMGMEEED